jgi:hypothetical protein
MEPTSDPSLILFLFPLVPILLVLLAIGTLWWTGTGRRTRGGRLAYVNEQLRSLYGPLYTLSHASEAAWEAFRARHRPDGGFFDSANPPTETELAEWASWMRLVFTPMNEKMVEAIVGRADLVEGEMPASFLALIAHVEGYKVALDKWERGDFSEYASAMNFPGSFNAEVRATFAALKARQAAMMR